MAKQNDDRDRGEQRLPPYVSYATFKGFVQKLKQTVVPPQIDSSVLRTYAGGVARKLTASLKFLGLAEDTGRTTDKLTRLVNAYETPEWPTTLSAILFDAYRELIADLSLESATPAMLDARFRAGGADGTTLQACVAFYVAAMRDAQVALSPLIIKRPRGRPGNGRTRKRQERTSSDIDAALGAVSTSETLTALTPQPGAVRFVFPIPDKAAATIFLPVDVNAEDWEMVSAMVGAYIQRREKTR